MEASGERASSEVSTNSARMCAQLKLRPDVLGLRVVDGRFSCYKVGCKAGAKSNESARGPCEGPCLPLQDLFIHRGAMMGS